MTATDKDAVEVSDYLKKHGIVVLFESVAVVTDVDIIVYLNGAGQTAVALELLRDCGGVASAEASSATRAILHVTLKGEGV